MKKQLPPKNNYWFILGREPLLAAAELNAVLNLKNELITATKAPPRRGCGGIIKNEELKIFKINKQIDALNLINQLGGTVKIGEEIEDELSEKKLEEKIINELKTVEGKINFGISLYGNTNYNLKDVQNFGIQIKKNLKQQGCSVRYVQNRSLILSSATVKNNGLTKRGREFLIDNPSGGVYSLAKTLAIQPFEQFSKRDYGRPGRDDKSGMLPPKLAMMMINLAQTSKNSVILDPFCGSGTILTEAMLLGYRNLIGSDISAKAIEDTEKNIEWTANNYKLSDITASKARSLCGGVSSKLYECDVAKLTSKIKTNSIDAIVAEPYMGKPLKGNETKEQLESQADELRELYLNAFQEFKKVLKKNGVVVFIIPRFKFKNEWIEIDFLTDIKKMGFRPQYLLPEHKTLTYFRPGQKLGRGIWKFVKYT